MLIITDYQLSVMIGGILNSGLNLVYISLSDYVECVLKLRCDVKFDLLNDLLWMKIIKFIDEGCFLAFFSNKETWNESISHAEDSLRCLS